MSKECIHFFWATLCKANLLGYASTQRYRGQNKTDMLQGGIACTEFCCLVNLCQPTNNNECEHYLNTTRFKTIYLLSVPTETLEQHVAYPNTEFKICILFS